MQARIANNSQSFRWIQNHLVLACVDRMSKWIEDLRGKQSLALDRVVRKSKILRYKHVILQKMRWYISYPLLQDRRGIVSKWLFTHTLYAHAITYSTFNGSHVDEIQITETRKTQKREQKDKWLVVWALQPTTTTCKQLSSLHIINTTSLNAKELHNTIYKIPIDSKKAISVWLGF